MPLVRGPRCYITKDGSRFTIRTPRGRVILEGLQTAEIAVREASYRGFKGVYFDHKYSGSDVSSKSLTTIGSALNWLGKELDA